VLFSSLQLYLQICIIYFGISQYLNFTRELWSEVQVQISETMRCLHPSTRETSEVDSKVQTTPGAPYWSILVCGMRVRKIQNKYFYLSHSNETFYIKALEYKEYFTAIDLGECWRVIQVLEDIQVFLDMKYRMFGQAVSKYMVCVMLWRHLTPVRKVILWGFQRWVSF
jgi:hypothetical protein